MTMRVPQSKRSLDHHAFVEAQVTGKTIYQKNGFFLLPHLEESSVL